MTRRLKRLELSNYLNEDIKRQKKLQEEQEEERTLRRLKESYEKSEMLFMDDIITITHILFKLNKEACENKDSF